jgi:hypothetical protein
MRERESDQEANIQQKVQRRVEWKRLYVIEDLQIILRGCEKRRTLRLNLMVVVSGVRACVSSKTVVTENRNDDDANVFFDVVPALFAQEPLLQRMFAIPYKLVSSKYRKMRRYYLVLTTRSGLDLKGIRNYSLSRCAR